MHWINPKAKKICFKATKPVVIPQFWFVSRRMTTIDHVKNIRHQTSFGRHVKTLMVREPWEQHTVDLFGGLFMPQNASKQFGLLKVWIREFWEGILEALKWLPKVPGCFNFPSAKMLGPNCDPYLNSVTCKFKWSGCLQPHFAPKLPYC